MARRTRRNIINALAAVLSTSAAIIFYLDQEAFNDFSLYTGYSMLSICAIYSIIALANKISKKIG